MLTRQIGREKSGWVIARRQIDKLGHALLDLAAYLFELGDFADGGVQVPERLEGVLPHFTGAGAAQAQDGIQKGATLKAERTRAGAQRAQEDEAAKPFVFSAETVKTRSKPRFFVLVLIDFALRVGEERIADKVILGRIVPADEQNRQSPARSLRIAGGRVAGSLVCKSAFGFVPAAQMAVEAALSFFGKIEQ